MIGKNRFGLIGIAFIAVLLSGCDFLEFITPGVKVVKVVSYDVDSANTNLLSVSLNDGSVQFVETSGPAIRIISSNIAHAGSTGDGEKYLNDNSLISLDTNHNSIVLNETSEAGVDYWHIYSREARVVVYLPAGIIFGNLKTQLDNGSITSGYLSAQNLSFSVINGNIDSRDLNAANSQLTTKNGNIQVKVDGVISHYCSTDNGNVETEIESFAAAGASVSAVTKNGNIDAVFSGSTSSSLKVTADVNNGNISHPLNFDHQSSFMNHFEGYNGSAWNNAVLRVDNGNISIQQ